MIAAWAGRYLPVEPRAEADATDAAPAADHVVRVAERGTGTYTVAIMAGRHAWLGDEPTDAGGDDLGPDPYQMLTAALGACTAMTLRIYANHRQWPLENVSVALTHAKIHAKDCAECETRSGQINRSTASTAPSISKVTSTPRSVRASWKSRTSVRCTVRCIRKCRW